jgi:cell division protein FtsN
MSTSACVDFAASKPRRSSRKPISQNLFGGAAIACVVLGCGWTIYTNILTASVYPTLGSARYDEPVIKSQPRLAARTATEAINEVFAALPEAAPRISKPATVAPITPTMFNERFAASEPQGVASNAANAAPPSEAPKLAEAPKETSKETSKMAAAPKVAAAAKPKETAPASAPVKVAALPVPPPPSETRPAKSPGASVREMAERAKAAVMSIASSEKRTISEKLWGKQPSQGSLLAYASADANITGSLGQNQNPALGGSAPYDRSTAVYDISAHMVYLPDGTKLEAHSGLGDKLDDPSSAKIRMRGVTPPHIYELKPREALFHGVPALRLTPIGGDEAIYGRSGLLAHSFMLGPNGDSNGCVSFRDYNAFLNAYRNQGIKRLAVVARVE